MKWWNWDVAERAVGLAAALLAVVALSGLCIVLVLGGGGTASDWAGWLQTVGSLVGIGIAIAVPASIQKKERQLREDAKAGLIKSVAHMGGHVARAMFRACELMQKGEPVPLDRLDDVRASCHILMAKDLPGYALVRHLELLCDLTWFISGVKRHNDGAPLSDSQFEAAQGQVHEVVYQSEKLAEMISDPTERPKLLELCTGWPQKHYRS